ncbi:MAG: murein L,D-transpeptidase [Rhizobiales bacterium]|nr:murein L,D-transpeptidase [Hyphomicrobiales bacterium]
MKLRGILVLLFLVVIAGAAYILWPEGWNARNFQAVVNRQLQTDRELPQTPLAERLARKRFELGQPVLLRVFKEEGELELWLERNNRYELALTYPICNWSGALGPKLKEGDGQSPEGYYLASPRQLKPDSRYYRAINVGFPNAFDAHMGRTGSFLMIHGDCVSIGCYAMTDAGIDDIYNAVESAMKQGQKAFAIHLYPFRMTAANLARHAQSKWRPFWENLGEGDRLFAASRQPPATAVCNGRYVFAAAESALPPNCRRIAAW